MTVLSVFVFLASVLAMEAVAWLTHRYVMHGPLWVLHASHHRKREGLFEANDLFGVFFSLPAIALLAAGSRGQPLLFAAGLGVTAYGAIYFLLHDVLVHRRVGLRLAPRSRYLRRLVDAHRIHHGTKTKEGAVSFGFVFAPDPEKLRARRDARATGLR